MKFFERCRRLKRILIIVCSIVGLLLGFRSISIMDAIKMVDHSTNRELIFYGLGLLFFIMLILLIILLDYIIKDAEEDLNAIVKLSENPISKA